LLVRVQGSQAGYKRPEPFIPGTPGQLAANSLIITEDVDMKWFMSTKLPATGVEFGRQLGTGGAKQGRDIANLEVHGDVAT
jgi:hypothetical protein